MIDENEQSPQDSVWIQARPQISHGRLQSTIFSTSPGETYALWTGIEGLKEFDRAMREYSDDFLPNQETKPLYLSQILPFKRDGKANKSHKE